MIRNDVISTNLASVWFSISDEPGYIFHYHAEYEIYYFIEGDIEYQVEGHPYLMTPGSLLLIPPKSNHGVTIKSSASYRRTSIHFLPDLLEKNEQNLLLDIFQTPGRYYPNLSSPPVDFLIQSIMNCRDMGRPFWGVILKHQIISLLIHLCQIQRLEKAATPFPKDERIRAIQQYLNNNLQKAISLEELARKFHLSKNYLNVIFRRELGTTVNQYMRFKRLAWARQEIQRGSSPGDVAYKVGFNDYSNFYRAYRLFFGVNPSVPPDENGEMAGKAGYLQRLS